MVLMIFNVLATFGGRFESANKSDSIPCASPSVVGSMALYKSEENIIMPKARNFIMKLC